MSSEKRVAIFDESIGDYKIYAFGRTEDPPPPTPPNCVELKYKPSGKFIDDGQGNQVEVYKAVSVMTQADEERMAFQIDGYFSLSPGDPYRKTVGKAFVTAKQQLIATYERNLKNARLMEFDRWLEKTECVSAKQKKEL